ncbi:uncharacterized protein [Gossypium hirsutum]|uniref:Retrovirus-related Pol polyprotein from transposon TNT 1-94-like beta-barrel domain-containing protein n=1 Tax=Gossypium hirsutum TaxID=3635 RepID=A0A1U8P815_GOSHI|nr:uncharacterized protein LOC107956125 [Gossypium hirsutum]
MKTYLQTFDLWEVVNANLEPPPLRANPTVAQIRQHSDYRAKRYKTMSCLQNNVSNLIFIRIMACETPKQAWDKLKEEFQRVRTIKQYSNRIMAIMNNIRLLGDQSSESRIVEKNKGELADRRSIMKVHFKPRVDQPQALLATKGRKLGQTSLKEIEQKKDIHLAFILKGLAIQKQTAGMDLMCNARFVNSWAMLKRRNSTKGQLIDSGCTNHMTLDAAIFKSIDKNFNSRVKVGNGQYIKAERKRDVLIDTPSRAKLVSNVLLTPKIDRNLISIA